MGPRIQRAFSPHYGGKQCACRGKFPRSHNVKKCSGYKKDLKNIISFFNSCFYGILWHKCILFLVCHNKNSYDHSFMCVFWTCNCWLERFRCPLNGIISDKFEVCISILHLAPSNIGVSCLKFVYCNGA